MFAFEAVTYDAITTFSPVDEFPVDTKTSPAEILTYNPKVLESNFCSDEVFGLYGAQSIDIKNRSSFPSKRTPE